MQEWGSVPSRLVAGLALVFAIALSSCAMAPAIIGSVPPAQPTPATTDATVIDAGLSHSLETAPAGTPIVYRLANGAVGSLVIGPLYHSGRGVPCRLGRSYQPSLGSAVPTSYPFCRIGSQWYAMKPVVISGY